MLIRLFKDLKIENKLIKKHSYSLKKNSPLHWAFYWADFFSIIGLLEYDYTMIFWKNKLSQGALEMIYSTADS